MEVEGKCICAGRWFAIDMQKGKEVFMQGRGTTTDDDLMLMRLFSSYFSWWFAVIVRVGWGKVRTERNELPYLTCSHNLCRESNSNMDIFEEPEKPSVSFILLFCFEFVFHIITLLFCSYLAYLYHPFLIRYIRELYSGHADRRMHDLHKTITYSRRLIQKVSFEECCHFYGIIFLSLGSSFQFPLSTFHAVV
jgi:hypothetical protein